MSPVILRYTETDTGGTYYLNWDVVERFVQQAGGQSYILLKSGNLARLRDAEAQEIAEQLDAYLDRPISVGVPQGTDFLGRGY